MEIDHAADVLLSGGTVIFPTDTVFGLGAHALKKDAIEKIYEIKGRDRNKPINILISDIDKLDYIIEPMTKTEEKLANYWWPGPLTLVLNLKESKKNLYNFVKNDGTIGVRIPNNEKTRELIRKAGGIIATTSVNFSGEEPATSISDIDKKIINAVDYVVDFNEFSIKKPSTVVKIKGGKIEILREGALIMEDLERALKRAD